MSSRDPRLDRDAIRPRARRPHLLAPLTVLLSLAALLGVVTVSQAGAATGTETARGVTRLLHAPGKIVPIPASIPHEEGDMVDRRIVRDLRWLASRFPIYVTDGYSGPLPDGGHAGCHGCHVKNSDHNNGLAVDIVPLIPSARCDGRWRGITRLARWAEPRPNRPVAPFRWVGYDGDSGHGCGHHLHLSWNHSESKPFRLAEWVEALPSELTLEATRAPKGGKDGEKPDAGAESGAGSKGPGGGSKGPGGGSKGPGGGSKGPGGGISRASTGGIAPRGSGD